MFDIARARAETPGCATVAHFNNAGTGLAPACVLDAVIAHLNLEARIGGYEAAAEAEGGIENAYAAIARMLNCKPGEVALLENATVAWQMAFHALTRDFKPGDRILTAEAEYASNYISYLQLAERTGAEIAVVPSDEAGALDVRALENMIDARTRLISVTHVPTNGGLVNPAAAIGRVARKAGVPYLLDACQSAGQLPLDVAEIGCDALTATGRKYLRGPRGTGFLFVREDILGSLEPPFIDLRSATWTGPDSYVLRPDARRFENWEFYVAGTIGLGVAVDYALSWGLPAIAERVTRLAETLRQGLSAIPGVDVTDIGGEKCGIVTFVVAGHAPDAIKARLAERGINVSVSRLSSTLLDMRKRGLEEVVRASVHYFNDDDEIACLVGEVARLNR